MILAESAVEHETPSNLPRLVVRGPKVAGVDTCAQVPVDIIQESKECS